MWRSARASMRRMFRTNGRVTTGFGIIKQSTANTVEVLDGVKAEVERINKDLPQGHGAHHERRRLVVYPCGDTGNLRHDRDHDALVGFVIFVFLGSIRATLIPLVTIPVCLVATFSVLAAFGYSINLVTLLALGAVYRPRRRRCDRRARERAPAHRDGRDAAVGGVQRHAPGRVRGHGNHRRARIRVRARRVPERQHRPRVRGARGHDRRCGDLLRDPRAIAVADDVLEAAAPEHRRECADASARPGVRLVGVALSVGSRAPASRPRGLRLRSASRSRSARIGCCR